MKNELCTEAIASSALPYASPAPADAAGLDRRIRVVLAFLAIYVIWGSTYLAIRVGVASVPPYAFAASRFLVAGAALYGYLRLTGTAAPAPGTWRSAAIVGGMLLAGGNGFVTWAEQRVPSGLAALVIATVPLWMNLLEWLAFGGARPGRVATLGLLSGFAGVGLLVMPRHGTLAMDPRGVAALLASAILWSTGSLLSRRLPLPRSPLMATAMEMISGGVIMAGIAMTRGEPAAIAWSAIPRGAVAALLYLVVFGSLVAFSAYVWLLRTVPAAHVATYAYVNPAVALALGVLAGDGRLDPRTLVASAVILGSVAIIIKAPRAATSEEKAP
ncbi:MAG: EamA family transporter [Acidobacteriota bacterium]